jgi:hypothetical protein
MTTKKLIRVKLERNVRGNLGSEYQIASINGAITLDVFAGRGVPNKEQSTKRVGDHINEREAQLLVDASRTYDVTVVPKKD